MDGQRIGSAKKIFPYHNALNLHKSKKQTVKDQFGISNFGYWNLFEIWDL